MCPTSAEITELIIGLCNNCHVIISQSTSTGKTMNYVKFVKYLNLIEARYFSIFILVESSITLIFFR